MLLFFVLLWIGAQSTALAEWRCNQQEQPKPIDRSVSERIQDAFGNPSYNDALQQLKKLLQSTSGDSKAVVYGAIAVMQGTIQPNDEAMTAYRDIFDLEDANTQSREMARGNLAMLLADQGKARDIIALYEHTDRPVCGEVSAEASYALALSYNAVGNDAQARKFFDAGQSDAERRFKQRAYLWTKWQLLRLRLDCVQKLWQECSSDFAELVRLDTRDAEVTRQLNVFLTRLRSIPELAVAITQLQDEGLITGDGLKPATSVAMSKGVLVIGNDAMQIQCPPAAYPPEARRAGMSGKVILELLVDENGIVQDIKVIESDPPGVFDEVAIKSAKGCKRFKAISVDGKVTSTIGRRTWEFKTSTTR